MDKKEAITRLKEVINKGDTLHTQLMHVSQSGMTRHIKVRQLKDSNALDWTRLVYTLSSVLFDDGYAIKHNWL